MNNLIKNISAEIIFADSTPTPRSYNTMRRQLPCGVLSYLHVPGQPEKTDTAALLVRRNMPDVPVPSNSVLFIPAGEEHCIITTGDNIVSDWMHISCTCTPGVDVTAFFNMPRVYSDPETVAEINGNLQKVISAWRKHDFPGIVMANLAGAAVMAILLRQAEPGGNIPGRDWQRVAPALELMHRHRGKRFTNLELAGSCFLSESRFRAVFRQTVGVSPGEYAERERIAAAILMLGKGESLEVIAAKLAYSDVSHFSRSFRKAAGMAPGVYRKKFLVR